MEGVGEELRLCAPAWGAQVTTLSAEREEHLFIGADDSAFYAWTQQQGWRWGREKCETTMSGPSVSINGPAKRCEFLLTMSAMTAGPSVIFRVKTHSTKRLVFFAKKLLPVVFRKLLAKRWFSDNTCAIMVFLVIYSLFSNVLCWTGCHFFCWCLKIKDVSFFLTKI